MTIIFEAIKKALVEGKADLKLNEASALTTSGAGVGGRVIYDEAFASLRMANPLRKVARTIQTIGSEEAFVVQTGNSTNPTNPFGYPVNTNVGTPNQAVQFWQLPVRDMNATLPIRTAVLDDVNNLEETVVSDLMLEFAQQEAMSMMYNNDQTGTTTTVYGGTLGLRGLNSYPGSTSAAAFGSNGSAITNGRHTVLQVQQEAAGALSYNDIANLMAALPAQYLYKPTTAWMMHPTTIQQLRKLVSGTGGIPMLSEVGDDDGGAVVYIFGHPVIPNPYMQTAASGNFPVYLAEWDRFLTIVDNMEMNIQRLDQTAPGFVTLFAEKRVCSSIRDVFAGVRLTYSTPPSNVATLSNLTMTAGALAPTFNANTLSYTIDAANTVTATTVTPTVTQANATVKVNGTTVASGSASASIPLNVGANTITVVVTAQDGTTTKTYSTVITVAAALTAKKAK
jgi:HK97 family phage major capsid protein